LGTLSDFIGRRIAVRRRRRMVDVGTGSATLQQLALDLSDAFCANMALSGRVAVAPEAAGEGCKQR